MNVIERFNEGQAGQNKGLYMGKGLHALSVIINGVQRARNYAVAAGPKVGKSTLVDAGFVIGPWEDAISKGIPIEFHYYSYEIDRVAKEFDYICHYLYELYGIEQIQLPEGQTVNGLSIIPLTSDYLMGQIQDDSPVKEVVKVSPDMFLKIKEIYETKIIPLFGEYNGEGALVKPGVINFVEAKENPTGIRNKLIAYAERNGQFIYETSVGSGGTTFKRAIGYKPNNPNKMVIIVMDHLRKLPLERGFKIKETVDKYLEYATELRNLCKFSFVHIIHLNRSMADIKRLQYLEDRIYPTPEDIKDTGNLSEECNYIITMFNPNDDKYHLKKHFGTIIKDTNNNILYPNMRTIHLVESRHCPAPQHVRVSMLGNLKAFSPFIPKKN